MNTTSTDAPSQKPTLPEVPLGASKPPGTLDYDHSDRVRDDGPNTLALAATVEPPRKLTDRLRAMVESEGEFQQAAELEVRERLGRLRYLGHHALTEAIALGEILFQTKARLSHGNWLPFLEAVGINARTAQNYLLLGKHQECLHAEYENNSDLTVSVALSVARRLNKPQPVETPPQPPVGGDAEQTSSAETVHPLPTVGVVGGSVDPAQVESRLLITRTIPPMKNYGDEDRVAVVLQGVDVAEF